MGAVGLLQRRPSPNPAHEGRGIIILAALAFGVGISLFLFLMVRARTGPMMDWGNPDTLMGVFRSGDMKELQRNAGLVVAFLSLRRKFRGEHAVVRRACLPRVRTFGRSSRDVGGVPATSLKRHRGLTLWFLSVFMMHGPGVFLFGEHAAQSARDRDRPEASYLIPDVIIAIGIWICDSIGARVEAGVRSCVVGGSIGIDGVVQCARRRFIAPTNGTIFTRVISSSTRSAVCRRVRWRYFTKTCNFFRCGLRNWWKAAGPTWRFYRRGCRGVRGSGTCVVAGTSPPVRKFPSKIRKVGRT